MRILVPALIAGLSVFLLLLFIWRLWGFNRRRIRDAYPDPEDIILPPPREPLMLKAPDPPPAEPPMMEPPPKPPLPPDAVTVDDMEVGDVVHCGTRNSHYRFRLVDKHIGIFEVEGGAIKRSHRALASWLRSRRSGLSYYGAFVPGMGLEFFIQVEGRVESIRVTTTSLKRVLLTIAKAEA